MENCTTCFQLRCRTLKGSWRRRKGRVGTAWKHKPSLTLYDYKWNKNKYEKLDYLPSWPLFLAPLATGRKTPDAPVQSAARRGHQTGDSIPNSGAPPSILSVCWKHKNINGWIHAPKGSANALARRDAIREASFHFLCVWILKCPSSKVKSKQTNEICFYSHSISCRKALFTIPPC